MFPNFWIKPRRAGDEGGRFAGRVLPRPAPLPLFLLLLFLPNIFLPVPEAPAAADLPPAALCPSGTVTLVLPDRENTLVYRLYELLAKAFREELFLDLKPAVRAGRGGGRALNGLLEEKADGCFLGMLQFPTFIFSANLRDRLYDDTGIETEAVAAAIPNALWVAESGPLRSLDDFILAARAEAGKGDRRLVAAGVGSYTDQHLATRQLERTAGISLAYLPLLGAEECAEAVRTGKVAACWGYAAPADLMPGLRPLNVASGRRSPLWPEVPTFEEAGRPMFNYAWFGLGIHASAPESVRAKCRESLAAVMRNKKLLADMAALGFLPPAADPGSEEAFRLPGRLREEALRLLSDYPLIPRQERLPGRPGFVAP
jgi:tripartite-type tricarboxylate transporter receptor subunit TctC